MSSVGNYKAFSSLVNIENSAIHVDNSAISHFVIRILQEMGGFYVCIIKSLSL